MPSKRKTTPVKEHLRRRYRPERVRILFIGEAPPASGRFFYQADSGLYRAMREAFIRAGCVVANDDFLETFRTLGCYLVDLCRSPVDRLGAAERKRISQKSEARLAKALAELRPETVIVVVRSIAGNVRRAEERAGWSGLHVELPYPGRWRHHRAEFLRRAIPLLHGLSDNKVQNAGRRSIPQPIYAQNSP